MSPQEISEHLAEQNPEALLADGFEDALLGTVTIFTKTIALYDEQKCIEILQRRDGMSEEEAIEFFQFNVVGAWVGEGTPAFATILQEKDL